MARALSIGLLLWLALAAPADAKEILAATVCGANGCATSRDPALIAPLAAGAAPVDPPPAAAPFLRVRLAIGEGDGKVRERFWTIFVPKGELIRGADGTWMAATDAYTRALKQVVDPTLEAYPAARLARLLAGDRPLQRYEAQVSSVLEPPPSRPVTDDSGIPTTTIGGAGAGALGLAALLLYAVRRRRDPRGRSALT